MTGYLLVLIDGHAIVSENQSQVIPLGKEVSYVHQALGSSSCHLRTVRDRYRAGCFGCAEVLRDQDRQGRQEAGQARQGDRLGFGSTVNRLGLIPTATPEQRRP